ncbi:hypothetical protein PG994_000700 [Apiospora phragmitis]|uniref:Uncharacterized protein n=1 Tax=Apiospora phragmitis TaxID=2905665 RepID=A0ABR1X715_9PEZI
MDFHDGNCDSNDATSPTVEDLTIAERVLKAIDIGVKSLASGPVSQDRENFIRQSIRMATLK